MALTLTTRRPYGLLIPPPTHRASLSSRHKCLCSNTATPPARNFAYLECERKFNITPSLLSHLDKSNPIQARRFKKAEPITFQDKYFDIHGEFLKRGIWVRVRTPTPQSAGVVWQAKLRIGETSGEDINSKFEEVSGEREVYAAIKKRLPTFSFLALKLLGYGNLAAVISTERQVWAECGALSSGPGDLKIVLDRSVAVPQTAVEEELPLTHMVGEVEATKLVQLGGDDVDANERFKGEELAGMDSMIERFMQDQNLFPTQPAPVGKLTAYFEWKKTTIEPEELRRKIAKALAMGRRMRG